MTSKEHTDKKQTKTKHTVKPEGEIHHAEKKHDHEHDKVHEKTHEKEKMKEALKASEEKNNELHDKYLRVVAEFDNYRKRTMRERADLIKTAGDEVLKKILPVIDNFERALKAMDQAQDINALKEGVVLIYNHFNDFIQQQGIKEIAALNEPFNIDLHEAVATVPAPSEEQKGKIIDVIEKGYILHDKIIRFSKVVVGE
jgi:molecular chaperone GrpE